MVPGHKTNYFLGKRWVWAEKLVSSDRKPKRNNFLGKLCGQRAKGCLFLSSLPKKVGFQSKNQGSPSKKKVLGKKSQYLLGKKCFGPKIQLFPRKRWVWAESPTFPMNKVVMYVYVCMYVCIYICTHTYMHACMHTYIHTDIYTHKFMCVRLR